MEVESGGGLHVYWCTKNLFRWSTGCCWRGHCRQRRCLQLKFDPAGDRQPGWHPARPRLAGTTRTVPPARSTSCREEGHSFPRYDYQTLAGALQPHIGDRCSADDRPPDLQRYARTSPLASRRTAGANRGSGRQLRVLDDILQRGGDGDAEPLWNLALLRRRLHRRPARRGAPAVGRRPALHPRRHREEATREDQCPLPLTRPGWPQCKSFAAQSRLARTCPLFAQNKSPFNHVPPKQPQPRRSTS